MPFVNQNTGKDGEIQNDVNSILGGVNVTTPAPSILPVSVPPTPTNLYNAPNLTSTTPQPQPVEPVKLENLVKVEDLQTKEYSLQDLMREAIAKNASDIHLVVGYRAAIRVDGSLVSLNSNLLTAEKTKAFSGEILKDRPDLDINKLHQVDLSYVVDERRFRVNIFKRMGTISIVARLIPSTIRKIDELGLPQMFKDFGKYGGGLILVTGPTGSGKSTTLASVINEINQTQKKNIVTLEDPVEFVFPSGQSLINQREFGIDFESWPDALKSILRQDPDVVLVGEMRDLETIGSAITVSETGHLVFATLHTNSASQSIDRIIDVFPENQQSQIRSQLANVIVAIASQRLVPLSRGGRKSVMELMIATSAVKNAIREGKTYQIDNMIQTGQEFGMISMEKSLAELVKRQEITLEVAKETTVKPRELEVLLNKS